MLRFAITFTIISSILCGLTYILLRLRLNLSKRGNRNLLIFLICSAILMVVTPVAYRVGGVSIDNIAQKTFQFAQYFLMGWIAMTMLTFLALEVVQQFYKLANKPFNPSKRIFLTEGVARTVLATTTLGTLGGLAQAEMGPSVKPVEVKLTTLPKSFDGFVITQISDVHVGPLIHEKYLNSVVDQVLATNPDVIAITGDLVDGSVEQLSHMMGPLARLKAKHGVYFCTGNHEYYSGAEEWIAYLESIGIHVFKNSNVILTQKNAEGLDESLMLAGVFDWQAAKHREDHRADPIKAAMTDKPVACKILLAHNPQSTEANAAAGFNLQLSGHTHAGQFYPFVFVAGFAHKYFEGLYKVNETMQVYVNRGTGYWGPPNRLGKSSEITKITLRST